MYIGLIIFVIFYFFIATLVMSVCTEFDERLRLPLYQKLFISLFWPLIFFISLREKKRKEKLINKLKYINKLLKERIDNAKTEKERLFFMKFRKNIIMIKTKLEDELTY